LDGNVIGVNTAIYSPSGGNVGIAFDAQAGVDGPAVEPLEGVPGAIGTSPERMVHNSEL